MHLTKPLPLRLPCSGAERSDSVGSLGILLRSQIFSVVPVVRLSLRPTGFEPRSCWPDTEVHFMRSKLSLTRSVRESDKSQFLADASGYDPILKKCDFRLRAESRHIEHRAPPASSLAPRWRWKPSQRANFSQKYWPDQRPTLKTFTVYLRFLRLRHADRHHWIRNFRACGRAQSAHGPRSDCL